MGEAGRETRRNQNTQVSIRGFVVAYLIQPDDRCEDLILLIL